MSYHETVDYLYNLQKFGIKFGLDNIRRLMSALGNPHESFLAVHVAGTNGKGSTSAITANILRAAGFNVGLFTSPHLISFTERIRMNGEQIAEDTVIGLAEEIRNVISRFEDFSPTFFEVVTAMAMLYFEREKADIAVLETGMGGRLDATNIIIPEISVITNISYDHKDFLGATLREISYEKAGIIKEGIPVVVSHQELEALEVIEKNAREKNAELYIYGKDFYSRLKREDISGICFDYYDRDSSATNDLFLPLAGEHQMQNASVAIMTSNILLRKLQAKGKRSLGAGGGKNERDRFIREGLKNVRWPGRFEVVDNNPTILIDAAHNPGAASVLAGTIKKLFSGKQIILVLGIMGDKDIEGIMKPLLPLSSQIILTSPAYSRSAAPERLAGIAESLGFSRIRISPTVKDAVDSAKHLALSIDSPLVIITGSFYTIGEAEEALGQKGTLIRLRE